MTIILRATSEGNPNKPRPINDRATMLAVCFDSFKQAFAEVDYTLICLLDKPTPWLRDIYMGETTEETNYNGFDQGNTRSFHRQLDLALESGDRYLLVEDDYLWLPEAGKILSKCSLPFFSPYDHPDHYAGEYNPPNTLTLDAGRHWRKDVSNTLTFGGQPDALKQEFQVLKSYGWVDDKMWKDVTQRVPLYSPIPTLATHLETYTLSPNIDWELYLKTFAKP